MLFKKIKIKLKKNLFYIFLIKSIILLLTILKKTKITKKNKKKFGRI
jgi:hypothetical protein